MCIRDRTNCEQVKPIWYPPWSFVCLARKLYIRIARLSQLVNRHVSNTIRRQMEMFLIYSEYEWFVTYGWGIEKAWAWTRLIVSDPYALQWLQMLPFECYCLGVVWVFAVRILTQNVLCANHLVSFNFIKQQHIICFPIVFASTAHYSGITDLVIGCLPNVLFYKYFLNNYSLI